MARPREFDLDEALDRAMQLFWLQGYHATTTRDLDTHLGIGHQSLYSAFGDKASLFRRVLRHYGHQIVGPMMMETLELAGASKRDVVRFIAQIVDFYDTPSPRKGCLIANVALEQIHQDQEVADIIAAYSSRLESGFLGAVEHGINAGEIDAGLDAPAAARALVCTVFGLAVAARSGAARDKLVDMASMGLRPLY